MPLTDKLVRDIRYSIRQLQRAPVFAVVAVSVLALGIGANTAIYSVADAVLFRAPPVRDHHELAVIYTTCRSGTLRCSSSYPDYESYREQSSTFADIAATSWVTANMGSERGSRLLTAMVVSGNYYELLGIGPGLGRLIQPADDGDGRVNLVAVLSHRLWRDHFGTDSAVIGSTIRLNETVFTVVGVTPDGFEGLNLGEGPDVTIPIWAYGDLDPSPAPMALSSRSSRWISQLIGRFVPGVSIGEARAEMATIGARLNVEFPVERGTRTITVDAVKSYVLPVGRPEDVVRFVLLLTGVVVLTLLLACANLANLLLMRATGRQREVGIRLALGAGRPRMVSQLMTESIVLAVLGGLAGLLVALWLLALLGSFELPGGVAIDTLGVALDARMLAVTGILSLLTGIVFGIIPALHLTRRDLVPSIKGEFSHAGGGHAWLRKTFVAAQVALCLVLLVASGLFLRTLNNALTHDPGFDPQRTALARFNLGLLRYDSTRAQSFVEALTDRMRAVPGAEAVGVGSLAPFDRGGFRGTFVSVPGYEPTPDEEMRVDYLFVQPEYFDALGMRTVQGRVLAAHDRTGAQTAIVINRTMADRYWPSRDAVGGTVEFDGLSLAVVGVVENATWRELGEEAGSFVFLSMAQFTGAWFDRFVTLAVRTTGDPTPFLSVIQEHVRALEPELSITGLQTMESQIGRSLMPQRMGALLLSLFGALAVLLAAVGIYGVVGFSVAQHARAIGIRMALGASARDVVRLISVDMARPVVVGLGVGLVLTLVLATTLERFLFEVAARDPFTIMAIVLLLGGIAALATWIPARRAVAIAPSEALRAE